MISLTSSDAMGTGLSKPVFKRSASLGFASSTSTKTWRKGNQKDFRYQPYSVATRRSLLQRSNSHPISRDDKIRAPDARTEKAPVANNMADLKQRHTQQRRSKTHNVNRASTELVEIENTFYNRLIKENNLYDMACHLKESLTISKHEKSATSPKCGGLEPTVDASPCKGEESVAGFHDCAESRGKTIVQNTENENAEERRCDCNNDNSYCDFFLPSFDDEICFPSLVCQDAQKVDKDVYSGERGQAPKHQKHNNTKNEFLDKKTVIVVLRNADTTFLFVVKENESESDNDFDFSVPTFPSQPLCEGDEAKLSWNQPLHEQCKIINNDCESDTHSFGNECDQHVDVRKLLLSDDLLNNNPSLMTSRNVNYDDLSRMQGTYTCSVCTANLEVDPFKSMQMNNIFSLTSFNGSSDPRSHDCDVVLYCPCCCSDRVVFHADRLRI